MVSKNQGCPELGGGWESWVSGMLCVCIHMHVCVCMCLCVCVCVCAHVGVMEEERGIFAAGKQVVNVKKADRQVLAIVAVP